MDSKKSPFLSSLQALLDKVRRSTPISTLWRAATSHTKPLLQTIRNATLSALDKCAHRLRKPFIADKDGYCKHCGYRLYKPQWLQELESKHATAQVKAKPKTKGRK